MMIRSKAINIECNEKNTKYFANLEKRHAEKKNINALNINNNIVTDTKEILNEEARYYMNLYKRKQTEISSTVLF